MKNKALFCLAIAATVLVFACKKKKSDDPGPDNNTDYSKRPAMLMVKNWKITSLSTTSFGEIWTNDAFVAPCNRDNTYWFRHDDSVAIYDGGTKCNSSDPDSTRGFYKLYNDNKQMILNMKLSASITLNDTADISELSDSRMKLNIEYSGIPGIITFEHP